MAPPLSSSFLLFVVLFFLFLLCQSDLPQSSPSSSFVLHHSSAASGANSWSRRDVSRTLQERSEVWRLNMIAGPRLLDLLGFSSWVSVDSFSIFSCVEAVEQRTASLACQETDLDHLGIRESCSLVLALWWTFASVQQEQKLCSTTPAEDTFHFFVSLFLLKLLWGTSTGT